MALEEKAGCVSQWLLLFEGDDAQRGERNGRDRPHVRASCRWGEMAFKSTESATGIQSSLAYSRRAHRYWFVTGSGASADVASFFLTETLLHHPLPLAESREKEVLSIVRHPLHCNC
jgi:hypothetical protein